MSDGVIEIQGLGRRFGKKVALENVSLSVPRGCVFGLVGENGAGKTTLIKHILGLLRAVTGSVRVFSLDPALDPVGVLSRLGSLSEDRDLPDWMRVDEFLHFQRAFYPAWDDAYAEKLRQDFALAPRQRISTLSRGQRSRVGLLAALAYRPELLVLDEPSSGLDPVVRQDILGAIIRTVADEGRTVLFSSHLLDEVERVADRVAMVHAGKVVVSDTLEQIKRTHRRFTVRFGGPQTTPPRMPGSLRQTGEGTEWTFLCNGGQDEFQRAVAEQGASIVDEYAPSLEEIFVSRVGS